MSHLSPRMMIRDKLALRLEMKTYISPPMYSRRPFTAATASVRSCFRRTGPTSLKIVESSLSVKNSLIRCQYMTEQRLRDKADSQDKW
jgi:hypothetical protein